MTVVPETVHTGDVSDEKLTGNPDEAVALTVNGDAASVRSASAPKLIVWLATVMDCDSGALLEAVLPASPP